MYLLSDFFIATQEQAEALDIMKSPVLSLPTVLARGVGFDELMGLLTIIAGSHARGPLFPPDQHPIRPGPKDDNPCILRVPMAVCTGLANADDDRLQEWAAAWALTKDWIEAGFPPSRLALLLKNLAGLARQAAAAESFFFVWLCDFPQAPKAPKGKGEGES